MKKQLFLSLFLLIVCSSFAQITYDKGYFIDNRGQRTECFIKNTDWKENPINFEYQMQTGGAKTVRDLQTTNEFGVYNHSSFIKATVQIDRSGSNVNNISPKKSPEFKEETLFLKVLVTGEASLYSYTEGNLYRYFYQTKDSEIQQLVYKKYHPEYNDGRQINLSRSIAENNHFRQQLWNNFKCGDITLYKVENTNYNKKDLVKFFNQFNACANPNFTKVSKTEKRDLFNLAVKAGVNQTGFTMESKLYPNTRSIDFNNQSNFNIGIALEYILPINRNKWTLAFEPTYQYYNDIQELTYLQTSLGSKTTNVHIDYKSIELPFGIRYYSFLTTNSKLFFNAFYVFDAPFSSKIQAEREDILDTKIRMTNNLAFGLGYQYKNIIAEFKIETPRPLINVADVNSKYQTMSIQLGYFFF